MRNRALHDALRDFALEAAALLTEDLKAGAEVEFDVVEEGGGAQRTSAGASTRRSGRGPALYRYEPRTDAFIAERWDRLRFLPAAAAACRELGAGASAWLRVNGLGGEQAEPALQAMLERLYEDSTSFGFPEERFERVYGEVELTLYRDAVRARVIAPLHGAWMDAQRVELGDGLSLVRGDALEGPHDPSTLLCLLERDVPADDPIPVDDAARRFAAVVRAVRLWGPGRVALGTPGWRQADHARWQPVPLGSAAAPHGEEWLLPAGEEQAFREFFTAMSGVQPPASVGWALERFEIGCSQPSEASALSDHLLALRGLLDGMSEAGQASLGLRLAALCAEEGARREVQDRLEAALALERFAMGGSGAVRPGGEESPRELVAEVEGHVRALLRDVLCGYLDADLKSVADDILLEAGELHLEIQARDLRDEPDPEPAPPPEPELDEYTEPESAEAEYDEPEYAEAEYDEPEYAEPEYDEPDPPAPRFERAAVTYEPELEWEDGDEDTAEMEAVTVAAAEPVQDQLDGEAPSSDWSWDEPEDYSAPV